MKEIPFYTKYRSIWCWPLSISTLRTVKYRAGRCFFFLKIFQIKFLSRKQPNPLIEPFRIPIQGICYFLIQNWDTCVVDHCGTQIPCINTTFPQGILLMKVFILKLFSEHILYTKTQVYNFQLCKIVSWLCDIIKVKLQEKVRLWRAFQLSCNIYLPSK